LSLLRWTSFNTTTQLLSKDVSTYRLLGIDPGTNLLGYAVLEVQGKQPRVMDFGVVYLEHLKRHDLKLRRIFERLQQIIQQYQPSAMAIEAPFFGKNPQSMLKLGRAQGVAMAAGITMGLEVTEYAPRKIKQSVTGNGNASKEQVAAMLASTLRIKFDNTYMDATDALGVALCHYYQSSSALAGAKKQYKDWSSFLKDNPGRTK